MLILSLRSKSLSDMVTLTRNHKAIIKIDHSIIHLDLLDKDHVEDLMEDMEDLDLSEDKDPSEDKDHLADSEDLADLAEKEDLEEKEDVVAGRKEDVEE
jgi:hypothetical protein